ncbi:MAG: diacylglycerol kinase family protein [Flavobacteriales bacterium]|jgi:diacylglycerol kinase (ATP)|tara:strand:+ start:5302 stop:5682 length:381 start_codon:yes stop_codon:yes gene_type:complete
MKNAEDSFVRGRIRSLKFAFKGAWLLLTTEDSIKAQVIMAIIITVLGCFFNISNIEWMLQFLVIGMVLVAESLNTAVEKIADFVHPDYHEKIGFIKDIAAGAPTFAGITSLIVAGFIYFPKINLLF